VVDKTKKKKRRKGSKTGGGKKTEGGTLRQERSLRSFSKTLAGRGYGLDSDEKAKGGGDNIYLVPWNDVWGRIVR